VDNPALGTISASGVLTPLLPGTITVIATSIEYASKKGELTVTILPDEIILESFEIDGSTQVTIGADYPYQIIPTPSDASNLNVNWEVSNSDLASISSTGVLHPLSEGELVITATSIANPSIYNEFSLTIYQPATSIQINGNQVVHLGTPQTYLASLLPSTALEDVIWSVSDQYTASIDQNGLLQPIQSGIVTIFATSVSTPTVVGSLSLHLYALVQNVQIGSQPQDGIVGNNLVLSANVYPNNAIQTLAWTVNDEAYATINPDTGLLHLIKAGAVTVTVTSTDNATKFATKEIVIYDVISDFIINGEDTIRLGSDASYSVSITPISADQRFTWSIDDYTRATISGLGVLHPLQTGTITLQVISTSDQNKTGSLTITIKPAYDDVEGLTVNGPTTVKLGTTAQYSGVISPVTANLNVTWGVDKPTYAQISASGLLTPILRGEIKVIATSVADGSKICEYSVTIDYADIISAVINGPRSFTWGGKEDEEYSITITPANANQSVDWSYDGNTDGEAKGANFMLIPGGIGEITLTATSKADSSLTWSITITVALPLPVSISPTNLPAIIFIGQEIDLTAAITPGLAVQTFTAASDSEKITINGNHLEVLAEGTATILFTSTEAPDVTYSFEVTILNYGGAMLDFIMDFEHQDYSIVREDGAFVIYSSETVFVHHRTDIGLGVNPRIGNFRSSGSGNWNFLTYDLELWERYNYFAYKVLTPYTSVNQVADEKSQFEAGAMFFLLSDGTIRYDNGYLIALLSSSGLHSYQYLIFDLNHPEFFLAAYEGSSEIEYDKYLLGNSPAPEIAALREFTTSPYSDQEVYTIETVDNYFHAIFSDSTFADELMTLINQIETPASFGFTSSHIDLSGTPEQFMDLDWQKVGDYNLKIKDLVTSDYITLFQAQLPVFEIPDHYVIGEFDGITYVVQPFNNALIILQLIPLV
jgi:uncharacterized protein YjdB